MNFGEIMPKLFKSIYTYLKETDKFLLVCSVLCAVAGIMIINSATLISGSKHDVITQTIAVAAGIVLMIVLSVIAYPAWSQASKLVFAAGLLILIFTLIFATTINGSRSWIKIFGISIQPSEIVKLCFILSFAAHLSAVDENINRITNVLLLSGHVLIYVLLVYLQGDMGSALVYLVIGLAMFLIAGLSWKYFLALGVAIVPIGFLLYKFVLSDYQINRILVIFNPELDPLNYGWQTIRSVTAIGSGKLTGQGYASGLMTQRGLIPSIENDSIFAAIGEELGFIGSVVVLLLLTALLMRILRVSTKSRDANGAYICIGVFAMLAFQMMENIGMSLGLLPIIGITLPFFSAGGSSMLAVFGGVGLVMSVHRGKTMFD